VARFVTSHIGSWGYPLTKRHSAPRRRRQPGIELKDIGAIVVNTITGLAIPSLDAKLMNRLDLPASVERLPIFGLSCGGGVAGLTRAACYAHAMPGAHVLFLTIDLCSLCLRVNDSSMAMFVSAALFGDGAAGVVLRNTKSPRRAAGGSLRRGIISGATPSTSWVGTSGMTAAAWC
jgi:alkylresorcinol/alkylpyrone synthase